MTISSSISASMKKSSWIRRMFEEGEELKRKVGAENVFDFSLGNPIMEPPAQFKKRLLDVVETGDSHGHTGPFGAPEVRSAIARQRAKRTGLTFSAGNIVMTCGAAGGFNVVLRAVIDSGDEIIIFVPYFVEYLFYIGNCGGTAITVNTAQDFGIDFAALEKALSPKTRAVVINSPNNPTGRVYDERMIETLAGLLRKKENEYGHDIFLLADEPYRAIVYNDIKVPEIFNHYKNSFVITSHSKDLGLAGERIGHIALHPKIADYDELRRAIAFTTRGLGFKSAPSTMQNVVGTLQDTSVDIASYERKRNLLCDGLEKCGFKFSRPEGAFYLFPKSPTEDDVSFVKELQKECILTVPGSGFGRAGHIRISYCVEDEMIERSLPLFEKVAGRCGMI